MVGVMGKVKVKDTRYTARALRSFQCGYNLALCLHSYPTPHYRTSYSCNGVPETTITQFINLGAENSNTTNQIRILLIV
jgi:hypothetical protein